MAEISGDHARSTLAAARELDRCFIGIERTRIITGRPTCVWIPSALRLHENRRCQVSHFCGRRLQEDEQGVRRSGTDMQEERRK